MICRHFITIFITLITVLCISNAHAYSRVGVVGAANKAVRVINAQGVEKILNLGDSIYNNDTIVSDAKGNAQLIFIDKSSLTIGSNSNIKIDQFIFDNSKSTGSIVMQAAKGTFRFVGGALSKEKAVKFNTPNGIIGIRGGITMFEVNPELGTTNAIFVYGKELTFKNTSDQINSITNIGSGFSTDLASGEVKNVKFSDQAFDSQLTTLSGRPGTSAGAIKIPTHEDIKKGLITDSYKNIGSKPTEIPKNSADTTRDKKSNIVVDRLTYATSSEEEDSSVTSKSESTNSDSNYSYTSIEIDNLSNYVDEIITESAEVIPDNSTQDTQNTDQDNANDQDNVNDDDDVITADTYGVNNFYCSYNCWDSWGRVLSADENSDNYDSVYNYSNVIAQGDIAGLDDIADLKKPHTITAIYNGTAYGTVAENNQLSQHQGNLTAEININDGNATIDIGNLSITNFGDFNFTNSTEMQMNVNSFLEGQMTATTFNNAIVDGEGYMNGALFYGTENTLSDSHIGGIFGFYGDTMQTEGVYVGDLIDVTATYNNTKPKAD